MSLTTDTIANSYYNLGSKVAMEKLAKISIPRALGSGALGLVAASGLGELTRSGLRGSSKYLDDFYTRTGIIDRLPQYDADIKLLKSLQDAPILDRISNLDPNRWAYKLQTMPFGRRFNFIHGSPGQYLDRLKGHLAEETETLNRLGGRDLSTLESALDYAPAAIGAGLGGLIARKFYKDLTRLNNYKP